MTENPPRDDQEFDTVPEYVPEDWEFDDARVSEDLEAWNKQQHPEQQEDGICTECDSTGEVGGRVCKSCRGKGYVQPSSSK